MHADTANTLTRCHALTCWTLLLASFGGADGTRVSAAGGNSLLQVKHAKRKLPLDLHVPDWSTGWGKLNPATCVEVVLIEPRRSRGIARAAESALRNNETDLLTLAHGALNVDYMRALVARSPTLSEGWQNQRLRYFDLHVGDLGGNALGSSQLGTPQAASEANQTVLASLGSSIDARAGAKTEQEQLPAASGHHDSYSRLLKRVDFWSQLACDHILIMQSDSLFCQGSQVRLSEFFGYGFVGGHAPGLDTGGRIMMNGGFSFRSRPHMLACIADNKNVWDTAEDSFYSHCPLLEQPAIPMAERFAVDNGQTLAAEVPVGVHRPWVGPFSSHTLQMCSGALELSLEQAIDP